MTPQAHRSTARIRTEMSRRYLSQLCKHFEHRLPVTLEEERGAITFPFGQCRLEVEPGTLVLQAEADDADSLGKTENVVTTHLLRFAFREPPDVVWQKAG